jgi:adenylate kinase
LLLDVPENVLVERVTGRRLDPVTGKIYHMKFNPPTSEEVHKRLIQRSDDTAEKVRVRYRDFINNIGLIKRFYEDRIVRVDGTAAPQTVSQRLIAFLKEVAGIKSRTSEKVSILVDASSDEELLVRSFATHSVLA